jgi:hypothetical protein
MRKLLLALSAVVMALGVPALSAAPASATGLTLACNVQVSANDNFEPDCGSGFPESSYSVTYEVQGVTGSASYAWTLPSPKGGAQDIVGCTSTDSVCAFTVVNTRIDQDLTATVVVTQDGSATTLQATALLNATCPGPTGLVFC